MAYTDVNAYVVVKTAQDNIFTKGGFIGEARIKAEPDHTTNKVRFSFAGYRGNVVPRSGYSSCSWSVPIKGYIGFSTNSYDDAISKAKTFTIADSSSPLNGYYPTSWTTPISNSIEVTCNDWGTPKTVYVYFRCTCNNSNMLVYDVFSGVNRVLDTNNSSVKTTVNADFPYLCDRVPPSVSAGVSSLKDDTSASANVGYVNIKCDATDYNDNYCYKSYKDHGWTYKNSTYTWKCNYKAAQSYSNGYIKLAYYTFDTSEKTSSDIVALYGNTKYTNVTITCEKSKNNKSTAVILPSIDLRIPKIALSNFSVDSNKNITFTMTPTVGTEQCYVYNVQYSLDGGTKWLSAPNGTSLSNSPRTFTVNGNSGTNSVRVRARREHNDIMGYSSTTTLDLTTPNFSIKPEYKIEGNGYISVTFTPNINCNYTLTSIGADTKKSYDNRVGSCSASTKVSLGKIKMGTNENTNIEVALSNSNYNAVKTYNTTLVYSILPYVTSMKIESLNAYTHQLIWSGGNAGYSGGAIRIVLYANDDSILTIPIATLSGYKNINLEGTSSYHANIGRTNDAVGNVSGYMNLYTTKYLGDVTSCVPLIKDVYATPTYSNNGSYVKIEAKIYDGITGDSLNCDCTISIEDTNGTAIEGLKTTSASNGGSIDVQVKDTLNDKIDPAKEYKIKIYATYSGIPANLDSTSSWPTIKYPYVCKIYDADKHLYVDAVAYVHNGNEWVFTEPNICTDATNKVWKYTTN